MTGQLQGEPLYLEPEIYQLLEAEMLQERKAPGTIQLYLSELRRFDAFMRKRRGGAWDLRTLARRDIVAYANHLRTEHGNRPSTQANKLSRLRSLFQYLVLNELLPHNPFSNVGRVRVTDRDRKERVRLTPEEAVRFLNEVGLHSRERLRNIAMMQVLIFGGLRVGELVALRRRDLDPAERQLHVIGKGGKYRRVGLPDNTIANLVRYCQSIPAGDDAPLFLTQRRPKSWRKRRIARAESASAAEAPHAHEAVFRALCEACPPGYYPLDTSAVYALVRRHAQRAGIGKPVTPHALRRTCATMLLKGGANIKKIQRILGHSQITTTMTHYADVEESEAAEAVREQHYLRGHAALVDPTGADLPPEGKGARRSRGRTGRRRSGAARAPLAVSARSRRRPSPT